MGNLTAVKVKSITKPGRYGDGGTLFLSVAPGGSKSWVQRVTIANWRVDERDGRKYQVFFVVGPDGLCYYFHQPIDRPGE